MPGKDAVGPLLFHVLERYLAKKDAGNDFEEGLFNFLNSVPAKGMDALKSSLTAYREIPEQLRFCLFKREFVEQPSDEPVSPETLAGEWLSEGLRFAGDVFYPKSGGGTGASPARPWSKTVSGEGIGGKEFGEVTYTAPWPWICRVFNGAEGGKGFRNLDHKPPVTNFQPHEFDQVCTYESEGGDLIESCTVKKPTSSGGDLFASCFGGASYTLPQACLKVPDAIPGQTIVLSGFNFLSTKCRIHLRKQDQSVTYPDIPVVVWPDLVTPLTDENGKTIADCTVDDRIEFNLPQKHPDKVATFPPGIYEVSVIVPNDGNHSVTNDIGEPPTQPAEFVSNVVLLNILPDPNLQYRITNDHGNCYEETDGPGGDEIWFTAGVASFNVGSGNLGLDIKGVPKGPWDDMDSGETTGTYGPFQFFQGATPAVALSLIGFEVDSEDAAKEQIASWGDAFGLYMKTAWELIVGSGAASGALAALEAISVVAAIVVAAIAIVVVVVIGFIWAAWAPADLIAADLWVWTAGDLFMLTDANVPMPASYDTNFHGIKVHVERQSKTPPDPAADFAKFTEERQYRCEDEDSLYGFTVHVDRLP